MQINLGKIIRDLRIRDGITQTMVANALGVTSQAVSRWETNGGYPDLNILPSIANYFSITIDELFGYNSKRDKKISKIIADAELMLYKQNKLEECIAFLKEAHTEFPTESQILLKLGYALSMYGFKKHGVKRYIKDGYDYYVNDVEYNSQNLYLREAQIVFQKALDIGISTEDRKIIIPNMVRQYALMGFYDEAEELAKKQDSILISYECLLPESAEGEKRDLFQGEALLALLQQIKKNMFYSIMTKPIKIQNSIGVDNLLGIAKLYELVFDDDNCGEYHFDLMDIYRWCAIYAARKGNIIEAMNFFETCFNHANKFDEIRNVKTYSFTSPLISKVTHKNSLQPIAPNNLWKGWQKIAPNQLINEIKKYDKYAKCFDKASS